MPVAPVIKTARHWFIRRFHSESLSEKEDALCIFRNALYYSTYRSSFLATISGFLNHHADFLPRSPPKRLQQAISANPAPETVDRPQRVWGMYRRRTIQLLLPLALFLVVQWKGLIQSSGTIFSARWLGRIPSPVDSPRFTVP